MDKELLDKLGDEAISLMNAGEAKFMSAPLVRACIATMSIADEKSGSHGKLVEVMDALLRSAFTEGFTHGSDAAFQAARKSVAAIITAAAERRARGLDETASRK